MIKINDTLSFIDEISGKNPTKKQFETLMLLNPFVKKTNYKEVAKILGTNEAAIQERMRRLKRRCPGIYWKFRELRKALNNKEYKEKVNNPIIISDLCEDGEQNECFDSLDIKETF